MECVVGVVGRIMVVGGVGCGWVWWRIKRGRGVDEMG